MKAISIFFLSLGLVSNFLFCMEFGWDLFVFIPTYWRVTPFLELERSNVGNQEAEKRAFIAVHLALFNRLYPGRYDFDNFTAQRLTRESCERTLANNRDVKA